MRKLHYITFMTVSLMVAITAVTGQELVSTERCYSDRGSATRCEPPLQSFSFNQLPQTNSTCGTPPTGFCSRQISVVSGTVSSDCSGVCNANNPQNAHPPEQMTDFLLNDKSWWQSENSPDRIHVVVIDLALETHVEINVVVFDFASLKPNCFYILRSDDFGETYFPFHYFATSCNAIYGIEPDQTLELNNETTILCQSIGLPPNPGQISFFPRLGRPSTNDSVPGYSEELYNFITATNIRVVLAEHYPIPDIASDDFGYYYGINDLNVVGSCQCNGHASACQINFQSGLYECNCQHNTFGRFCESCSDFYQDVPWRRANGIGGFECRACNCNGHSTECTFDPIVYRESGDISGGVCLNCSHNTSGRQCENCEILYYPVPGIPQNDPTVCQACDCNVAGVTNNGECAQENGNNRQEAGDCFCKTRVMGRTCDQCIQGYFNLSFENPEGCQECSCDSMGAMSPACNPISGTCQCRPNIIGDKCNSCLDGYYLPNPNSSDGCLPCNCNLGGSLSTQCNSRTGQCLCRNGINGRTCSETVEGNYFPSVDFLRLEAENNVGEAELIIGTTGENTRFTGTGYARITDISEVLNLGSLVLPADGQYEVVLRYNLMGASSWESVTLAIVPDPEVDTILVSCGDTPEILNRTSFTYTSLMMGFGMTNTQTVCLRGSQTYTFLLLEFQSGLPEPVAILDIDSLVLIPIHVESELVFSNTQLITDYLSCVNQYRSLPVQSSASLSCVDTIYIVSTAIYNGTLECNCDQTGMVNGTSCQSFGGMCSCLPGVRGQQCNQCNPGYFNFSNTGCSRCNCNVNGSDNEVCDPISGACQCLDNITGRDCSSCDRDFYGFNEFGCIPCTCNSIGSMSTQCDVVSGMCECQSGVSGALCNQCAEFQYGFGGNGCSSCECDLNGSLNASCDILSGQCSCFQNTIGRNCSQCRSGTFNLQENNPYGCQNCFCSGQSGICTFAEGFVRSSIFTEFNSSDDEPLNGWSLVSVDLNTTVETDNVLLPTFGDRNGVVIGQNSNLYLNAPREYLAAKLSSYSQHLFVNINPVIEGVVVQNVHPNSVILISGRISLGTNFTWSDAGLFTVQLHETAGWLHTDSLAPATAYELQLVLSSLDYLLISASYDQDIILTNISFDTAISRSLSPQGDLVMWVEQCVCPAGYSGFSCEQCASGYMRTTTDTCEPCECNGLSNTCDPETGMCTNCSQSTTGTSCEQCIRGTYGNPTLGVSCETCPCPLTESVGQFSDDCILSPNGSALCTSCPVGHSGANCETCRPGYFGDPTGSITGQPSMCSDCECSGNIDPADPLSCNELTGMCLQCLSNTDGTFCERCADGFYGDAIISKNCTACECNLFGSDSEICDSGSGQCPCLSNVVGRRCAECAPEYYGFGNGLGCLPCNCDSTGAVSSQCDNAGGCQCQPGVTGSNCDQCLIGYFNFTANGCQECSCSSVNSESSLCQSDGVCDCRPGSIGSDCAQCVSNYFQTDQGCTDCPSCYQELEEETRQIETRIISSQTRFNFITQMLNDTGLSPLDPRFIEIQNYVQDISEQVGSLSFEEAGLNNQYNDLFQFITDVLETQSRQIQFTLDALKRRSTPILVLASTAQELINRITNEFSEANTLLNIIRNEVLPVIESSANSVNDSFYNSEAAYQSLDEALTNVSGQEEELQAVISELELIAESSLTSTDLLSSIIYNTATVVDGIVENQSIIERRVDHAFRRFASLDQSTNVLADQIERLSDLDSTPPVEALEQLVSNANMTEVYISTDISSEISNRYQQLSALNQSLNVQRVNTRLIQQQVENSESLANSQIHRGETASSAADQAVESANQNLEYAKMVLSNLQNFKNHSSLIAFDVNRALDQVNNINSSVLLAIDEAQSVHNAVGGAVDQIDHAKNIATEAVQDVLQRQLELSSLNTSSILLSATSNVQDANTARDTVNTLLNETRTIEMILDNQHTDIENTMPRVNSSKDQASMSQLHADNVQDTIRQLTSALGSVKTNDIDEVSDIERLLFGVFDEVSSAAVGELYDILTNEIMVQQKQYQEYKASVEALEKEVNYLRKTLQNLPSGCPNL